MATQPKISTNGTHAPQVEDTSTIPLATRAWRDAVAIVTQRALDHYGDALAGRLDKARRIVLAGGIRPDEDIILVSSETDTETSHTVTREGCTCSDAEHKAPQGLCKHLLAWQLYRRAYDLAKALVVQQTEPTIAEAAEATVRIPSQFITRLHGREFVQFGGLLAMAHEQGLQSLTARFVDVQAELATAEATAQFGDGRTFTECGDATPSNVHPNISPHFARMALTRAKARALRDALNIGMCCVEEIGEESRAAMGS